MATDVSKLVASNRRCHRCSERSTEASTA
jgi:hypothetical protein